MPSTTDLLLRSSHASICAFLIPQNSTVNALDLPTTSPNPSLAQPHIRILPPSLSPSIGISFTRDGQHRRFAMASSNVFTDAEFCLSCEKVLRGGVSFFCDDVCRAREGEDKVVGTQYGFAKPGESPLVFASLPPLIASQVHAQSMARQRSQGASTSNSSQSETSSPLQSPSPLGGQPIVTMEGSPREEMFLPPPAFQIPHQYMTIKPVKVPAPYQASLPASYVATRQNSFKGEPATINDSTLHYGRRPAQTNSMTSPLALYPVGNANARRRESQGTGNKPRHNGFSPAMQPSRVVSDGKVEGANNQKTGFAYGMHSPLVLAANRRPSPPTSIIDFTHARPTYSSASSDVQITSQANLETYRPNTREAPVNAQASGTNGSMASTFSARRKSFPAHLMSQYRPVLTDRGAPQPFESTTEDFASPRRGRSRQRAEGAVEREPSRRASRSSRDSDGSSRRRDHRSATLERVGRPGVARRLSSDDRDHRTAGPRQGARLGYIPSPPRSQPMIPTSSSAKLISPQPSAAKAIGANDNIRNTFLGRDLSTIMASYQQAGAVQPRFGPQEDEDDISEVTEEAESDFRGRRRRSTRGGGSSPRLGRGKREELRAQADKESQAAREVKRLFDEGVSVS